MDPVSVLRSRLLPVLERWAEELALAHPEMQVKTWDWTVGTLTDWQGHDFGIDCLLPGRPPDESDSVALSVAFKHLDRAPLIHSADVVWGHPSGQCEAELYAEPVEFSDAQVERLMARLPGLLTALKVALDRGHPPPHLP
ncbi:hypothetical protein [Pyxidicoccus xibeiensis]|uniref:hypothetical protein n=1 Tax=Pyxidicoccus xibeiensis TaxID=2906759 RepID=UPI0020A6E8F1|nr:hypothetical protein [Pyxidicoccus xibeiensis]MCP3143012.1 hypothetical protein [Pyxidicoccus xibeiensis]